MNKMKQNFKNIECGVLEKKLIAVMFQGENDGGEERRYQISCCNKETDELTS